jgi:hypothetical protein
MLEKESNGIEVAATQNKLSATSLKITSANRLRRILYHQRPQRA